MIVKFFGRLLNSIKILCTSLTWQWIGFILVCVCPWNRSDFRKVIRDTTNSRPFCIVNSDPDKIDVGRQYRVEVAEALSAEFLQTNLPVVYDRYEPSSDSLISRSLDRIFGEVTKGYQETERMLGISVPIVGIGKLTLEGDRMFLRPPDGDRGFRYIVTTLSKQDIIRSLRSEARVLKVFLWLLGVFGVGLLAYVIYRNVTRWVSSTRFQQMLDEVRRNRSTAVDNGSAGAGGEDTLNPCVVCLTNRREVVLLECGHICLCADCAAALPEPKKCPVCRARVTRFVPTYIS